MTARRSPSHAEGAAGPRLTAFKLEFRIRELAARQHGIVSRQQLLRAAIPEPAIDYRVRVSRLKTVHRGVYMVGPIAGPLARETAAVLSCGALSVLSHSSAARLWGLIETLPSDSPIDISGPRTREGPRKGVHLHRVASLPSVDRARKEGLPTTSPERTLLDLAFVTDSRQLQRLLSLAVRRRLVTPESMIEVLARHPGRRGTRAVRRAIDCLSETQAVRSVAEERFLELLGRVDLPRPVFNIVVEGLEVDFLWRGERLVVEVDGFQHHSGRTAFERDRARDGVLVAAGFRVIRFSWRQITREPETVLVRVAQALAVRTR